MKRALMLLQLFLLILSLKCDHDLKSRQTKDNEIDWKCPQMDTALITFEIDSNLTATTTNLQINYQYEICNECDLIPFKSIRLDSSSLVNSTIDSYYSYWFEVRIDDTNIICDRFIYRDFGECGVYRFEVEIREDFSGSCRIVEVRKPQNSDLYMILFVGLIVVFFVVSTLIEKYHVRALKKLSDVFGSKQKENKVNSLNETKLDEIKVDEEKRDGGDKEKKKPVKQRLQSLDTFRGFSLFLMIFVNYGSGGYKYLQHVPWHGITLADFVFPWFLWIMGFSIPLATHSLINKPNSSRLLIFKRILIRSLKMFAIGIVLNTRYGVRLDEMRIMGVLQRIAICYFLVATLELVLYTKITLDPTKRGLKYYLYDLIWSKWHLLVMAAVTFLWFMLIYMVQIDGCPRGYMGPGGLEYHGKYFNCTGGVTGYFDILVLGRSHLYRWPTPSTIYKTTQPFDPEGFLGTLNCIILTYLGVQAGRLITFYKSNVIHQLINWSIWGLACLLIYFALTLFDMQNGPVPVNKNLWTFSFTLITGASSYLLFIVLFIVIDVARIWSGCPIIYLGMNSIVIYFCHGVFSNTFPVYWIVSNDHLSKLLLNLWGAVFWNLVAVYMYLEKIFINL